MVWKIFEPVASTNIAQIKYDEESKILEVTFKNGKIYQYYDIPKKVSEELEESKSRGNYFNLEIRGSYRYQRMD